MLELLLNVNEEMRLTKTRFWNNLEINPICDPDHVTLAAAEQLTGESKLKTWWERPGFKKWFCDGNEFETKLSAARFTAIDTLLDIMSNPGTAASARVAAAKQIMDHAKATESESKVKDLEKILKQLGMSSEEELRKYIK